MFTLLFWKAAAERMVRGAAIAVFSAYFVGDGLFDALNVNTWEDVASLALGGAFGSLVLSLTGEAVTKNGPSLTNQETLAKDTQWGGKKPQHGYADAVTILVIVVVVILLLVLFGFVR